MDQHLNRELGVFVVACGEVFSFRQDWHQHDPARPLVRQYQLQLDAILRDRPDLENCAVLCCHCGIRFFTHPRNAGRGNIRCPFGCREHHRRQRTNERSKKHYRTDQGRKNKKSLNGKRSLVGREVRNSPAVDASPIESAIKDAVVSGVEPKDGVSTDTVVLDTGAVAAPTDEHAFSCDSSSSLVPSLGEPTQQPTQQPTQHRSPRHVHAEPPRRDVKVTLEGFTLDEVTLVNSSMLSYLAMFATLIERRPIGRGELLQLLRRSMRQRSIGRLPRREYVLRYLQEHPP